jgi:hypothetical protein
MSFESGDNRGGAFVLGTMHVSKRQRLDALGNHHVAKRDNPVLFQYSEEQEDLTAFKQSYSAASGSASGFPSSSQRGSVKRTALTRGSVASNISSSSSSSSSYTGNRIHGGSYVRKKGHVYRFQCGLCDYGTDAGISLMQVHIRAVHEKKKDFECPVCEKGYGQSGDLKRHRESVHEGVRHECPMAKCDKHYAKKTGCVDHIKNKHGGKSSLVPVRAIELLPGLCVPMM